MKEEFVEFMKRELDDDVVFITCGLPATYKTETSEIVAGLKGYKILRTDLIRLEVLKNEDIFDEKVASNMNKRELVYDEMFRRANEYAASGQGFILDATFVTQTLRSRAAEIAAKHNRTLVIQQTQCPEEVSLERISKRTKENYESNALTPQAYYNNKEKFETVDLDDLKKQFPELKISHLIIDTTSDESTNWSICSYKVS